MKGLEKTDHERLSPFLRDTKGAISVTEVTRILGLSMPAVAKLLVRWVKQGWRL